MKRVDCYTLMLTYAIIVLTPMASGMDRNSKAMAVWFAGWRQRGYLHIFVKRQITRVPPAAVHKALWAARWGLAALTQPWHQSLAGRWSG